MPKHLDNIWLVTKVLRLRRSRGVWTQDPANSVYTPDCGDFFFSSLFLILSLSLSGTLWHLLIPRSFDVSAVSGGDLRCAAAAVPTDGAPSSVQPTRPRRNEQQQQQQHHQRS
ncbi:hypothetical protein Q8A73_022950 [Channa argus]|nr:hypothetical protein Q8A73_022950 [Channa argus]